MQIARAALIAVVLTASSARASGLNITPIQLRLSPQTTKAMLTLRNDGPETVRYQVSATSWNQTSRGVLQLAPTGEVLFFPALFTLKAGEERNVRVGVGTPFGLVEKTYRVFVEELPPTERLIFLLHDVEGYDHARIAHTLGMEEQESQFGLHQARLCVRELVSSMV